MALEIQSEKDQGTGISSVPSAHGPQHGLPQRKLKIKSQRYSGLLISAIEFAHLCLCIETVRSFAA